MLLGVSAPSFPVPLSLLGPLFFHPSIRMDGSLFCPFQCSKGQKDPLLFLPLSSILLVIPLLLSSPVTYWKGRGIIHWLNASKVPVLDFLPALLLKTFPKWETPQLAALFTAISGTGVIPKSCFQAIIQSIYKRGSMQLTALLACSSPLGNFTLLRSETHLMAGE